MKTLVVYDSVYGNCEKVANAIGKAISSEAKVIRASEANSTVLGNFELLIVGSPTHGGRPMESVKAFLENIPADVFKGKKAVAFDTRFSVKSQGAFLKLLVKVLGHASSKISKALDKKGAKIIAEPHGFSVTGKEGPLEKGELERAQEWAKTL